MKLYLVVITLVLLMSPMAFADLPTTVATRLIYDNNFMIIDTKETREVAYSISTNPTYNTTDLNLYLGPLAGISFVGVLKSPADQTNLTFVAEVMLLPNGSRYPEYGFDCFNETDDSLKYLIKPGLYTNCWGASRLRKLTQEETDQMNKFKSSPEAVGNFKVIFDSNLTNGNLDSYLANGNLTSRSNGLDYLELSRRGSRLEVTAEETIYDKNGVFKGIEKRSINLFRYEDKSFAIEGTKEKVDCKNTDVEELWVVRCHGNIRARSLKDGDLPKLV